MATHLLGKGCSRAPESVLVPSSPPSCPCQLAQASSPAPRQLLSLRTSARGFGPRGPQCCRCPVGAGGMRPSLGGTEWRWGEGEACIYCPGTSVPVSLPCPHCVLEASSPKGQPRRALRGSGCLARPSRAAELPGSDLCRAGGGVCGARTVLLREIPPESIGRDSGSRTTLFIATRRLSSVPGLRAGYLPQGCGESLRLGQVVLRNGGGAVQRHGFQGFTLG